MVMRFSVGANKAGKFSWWLYSSNGEMVAWAGESFDSEFNARRACAAFKVGARTARYESYQTGTRWYWRAWRSSDKVAASGEDFVSKSNADRAAANVRDNAGSANGP